MIKSALSFCLQGTLVSPSTANSRCAASCICRLWWQAFHPEFVGEKSNGGGGAYRRFHLKRHQKHKGEAALDIRQIIAGLESATTAERFHDGQIATTLGWRRKVKYIKTEGNEEPAKRVLWLVPSGNDPGQVPYFTTSIDAAVEFMHAISPSDVWGVSCAGGRGTAVIGSGPYCHAPTPAMALCIAALKAKAMRDGDDLTA